MLGPTAAFLVQAGLLVLGLQLNVSGFRLVWARGGHGWPGLFFPKPSSDADCPRCGISDPGTTVRQRPLASIVGGGDRYSVGYSVAACMGCTFPHLATQCRGYGEDGRTKRHEFEMYMAMA